MPKYYEISEAAAKRAKAMNSYSDYAPGSATAGYRAMVDEAYALAEKQKAQVDPMYHDKIDALVDRYARRLAENLNERNAIDARVPSILITGGGNFPVAKKAKQNAARDRNYGEYAEIEKLLDKIRSTGRGGISADDDLAVEKLTKKLEGMESQQTMMKAVNAYYRKHKTLEGCPELTAEQVEKVKAAMSQDWCKDPVPFPSYLLTNNNANIRRVRQRIEELSHKAELWAGHFPAARPGSMRRKTACSSFLRKNLTPTSGRRSKARASSGRPARARGSGSSTRTPSAPPQGWTFCARRTAKVPISFSPLQNGRRKMYHGEEGLWTKTKAMRSSRLSCWKTAGALCWGITPLRPRPMSHGPAMTMTRASGSMSGDITAATVPLWNRTLQRGCRNTSAFTMSVSGRPRLPAFTSIIPPSVPWTLGHSPSRLATPRTRSSTTISASRLKMGLFWRGGI